MAKKKLSPRGFMINAGILIMIAAGISITMKIKENADKDYIGRSPVRTEERMTPEMMLTLGRISSPRLSPDGKHILYSVTYTSIEQNRSCSNLFICNADGSDSRQLTRDTESIDNAVWCGHGGRIAFIQNGQIFSASVRKRHSGWKLGKKTQLSDIKEGIREFSLSPDGKRIIYVKSVKGSVKSPADIYRDLDKADAICADDLMYRHWDHWAREIPHTFVSAVGSYEGKCITEASSTDILGKDEALYELPAEPFGGIEQLSWSPDGRFIAYSCKKLSGKAYAFSTDSEIYIFDTGTGQSAVIPTGGGYDMSPVWSPDGTSICWISMERDGYEADRQRLMLARIDTAALAEATASDNAGRKPGVSAPSGNGNTGVSASSGPGETDLPVPSPAGNAKATAGLPVWIKDITEISAGFKYNVSGPVWDGNGTIYFNALAEGIQGIFRAIRTDDWRIERITGEDLWYDFGSPFGIIHNVSGNTGNDLAENNGDASGSQSVTLLTSWCSMNFPTELVAVTVRQESEGTPDGSGFMAGNTNKEDDAVHSRPLPAECPAASGHMTYRQLTQENTDILSRLTAPSMEARYIKTVDGKDMLTWIVFPPDFDRNDFPDAADGDKGKMPDSGNDTGKIYPAIEICLGGPQGTLSQGWSYRWNYRLMAEQGYVVILPNRRGTTAFGQEWTEQISGDYCGLNMQDYLSAARVMKSEPYIGKIAACGASYGGYSVYNLCGIHGNTFDAFVAHAGIFNQEHMYMTTEEMWFPNWDNGGTPEECSMKPSGNNRWPLGPAGDGETFGGIRQGGSPWSSRAAAVRHYANSPHKKVTAWHTPLLVTHGGMDFRVPADQGMAAYNAAQMMGVPSGLIIFPDENHWILKPQNALFWHREYFDWLDRWCK